MCPNCRAFITTDDKVCPYCQMQVGGRAIDRRSPSDVLGGLIPAGRFTTTLILLINFGLYAVCAIYSMQHGNTNPLDLDGRTIVRFGASFAPLNFHGQWWRLITAGFLHGGIFHILMNSWVLFDIGAQVEEIFGPRRMVVIYIFSTVTGFTASTFWAPLSVGSSAGIFGLIGAMIAMGMQSRSQVGDAIKSHYMRWAFYGLLMGLMFPMTDNAAHLGGVAGGFVCAWIAGTPRLFDDAREKVWGILAGGAIAITAYSFLQMFLQFNRMG
jgi:rhomboid protease GluP